MVANVESMLLIEEEEKKLKIALYLSQREIHSIELSASFYAKFDCIGIVKDIGCH